jgi:predicted transport protein
MFPVPNGFPDIRIDILLHTSKIVDKKQILRTVSNAGIYCLSDEVGIVY